MQTAHLIALPALLASAKICMGKGSAGTLQINSMKYLVSCKSSGQHMVCQPGKLLGVAEPSLLTSQRHADPCYCWPYSLQGYVKEKQRPYCWETPGTLQAAQSGHLSTSDGQTSQNSSRAIRGLREIAEGLKGSKPSPSTLGGRQATWFGSKGPGFANVCRKLAATSVLW